MEQWFTRLVNDFPHLSSDGIRLMLYIDRNGPLVPVGSLQDELSWDKPRIAKAINELTGKSVKKSWLNRNAGTSSPALIREDIDPSDLRAKTLTLTPLGTSYSRPEFRTASNIRDVSNLFSKIKDLIIVRTTNEISNAQQFCKNHEEKDQFISNSRALSEIALLTTQYLETKSHGMLLTNSKQIETLMSWVDIDALKADAESNLISSYPAKNVIDKLNQSALKDEKDEIERVARIIGYTHATIKYFVEKVLDLEVSPEKKLLDKIGEITYEDLKNKALMCLSVTQIIEEKLPVQDKFFYERCSTSAINWLIVLDKFRSFSTMDLSSLNGDDIFSIAREKITTYVHNNEKNSLVSLLQSYIFCFPENSAAYNHQQTLSFIDLSKCVIENTPIINIQKPLISSFNAAGYSAFINHCPARKKAWALECVRRSLNNSTIPIVFNPDPLLISFLKENGISLIKATPDVSISSGNVLIYENESPSELYKLVHSLTGTVQHITINFHIIVPDISYHNNESAFLFNELVKDNLRIHIHFMFDHISNLFNPLCDARVEMERIKSAANFWQRLSGLGVGLIDAGDYDLLTKWCLAGVADLPPLNLKALSNMPTGRFVDYSKFGWEPKPIDGR